MRAKLFPLVGAPCPHREGSPREPKCPGHDEGSSAASQQGPTVSARLAVTLRLLDRIGCEPAGATVRGDDEGLTVPEWRVL